MNTYVVLLRRMLDRPDDAKFTPLDRGVIACIAKEADVQLLNLFATVGTFDGAILCRAPNNQAIARLLDGLDGWYTDALIATSHIRFQAFSVS